MSVVHYTHCPVCDSPDIDPLLTVKDHSVSGADFVIWQCRNCGLRFTQDAPDEASIGTYYQSPDYISHSNTSKGLVNRLYQGVRQFTLERKARFVIRQTKQEGRVLDLGAGIGAFLQTMKQKGWETIGIEPDAGARAQAMQLFRMRLGEPFVLDQLPDTQFEAITLWHVLEHVHQLHDCMEKLKELLKPDGKIFIAVPNYTSLDSEIYKLYWAAYDVPRHLYHFSPGSMEVLAQRHGLRITQKKPMWFDSFYISLLSSKYKNGHTSWIGAGLSGIRSNLEALTHPDRCSSLIYVMEKEVRKGDDLS